MTTPPVAAIEIRLLFHNIKFSWNPNPKPFNKFDIETQALSEDTVFPYKRTSQSSLDCSKPSTMTTTPKIRFFIESPRTPTTSYAVHHMTTVHSVTTAFITNSTYWTFTVNDITPSTSPSLLITISRSQSRITSSTLSIWKNTYSNFNMVTIGFINTMTILNTDIIHEISLSNTTISYQTSK